MHFPGKSTIFDVFPASRVVLSPGNGPNRCAPRFPASSACYFLEISHLGPKNDSPCLSDNMASIFGLLPRSSSQGPLMEKEGTGNVYLDGQVMGSNPGEKSRSHGKRPKSQNQLLGVYNYPRFCASRWAHCTDAFLLELFVKHGAVIGRPR